MMLPTSVATLEQLDIEPAGVQVATSVLQTGWVDGLQMQNLGFMRIETFNERVIIDQCFLVASKTKRKVVTCVQFV